MVTWLNNYFDEHAAVNLSSYCNNRNEYFGFKIDLMLKMIIVSLIMMNY